MIAFVTGASRGLGRAIAVALAESGYDVAIAARTLRRGEPTLDHSVTVHRADNRSLPGSLEETAELIEAAGRRALCLRMDLTELASVERGVADVLDQWERVDLVVNNGRYVGPGLMDTVLDTPAEQYRRFVEAHAIAPIRIAQLLLPGMLRSGAGTFITISSIAAIDWYPPRRRPGLAYRLGKAAGHTLTGALLAEHGDQGIRAFNVDPGRVVTERKSLDPDEPGRPEQAPPMAVARAIAWLAGTPEADGLMRTNLLAQQLALEHGLHPDWRRR
jgi:NAD(P)-dependent dehydrogenase (short-subunit alcohol dehydrogenase family)